MKRLKKLILPFILITYGLLYIATSKDVPCGQNCEMMYRLDATIAKNRTYIWYVSGCGRTLPLDTFCIYVRDTLGINWDLLADTACQTATQIGFTNTQFFIIKSAPATLDTLARKQCP